MEIAKIEPIVVSQTLDQAFYFSQWEYQKRTICLVKVTTESGLVGWGEGYGPFGVVKAAIEFFTPFIISKNALEHEVIWEEMYRRSLDFARSGTFLAGLSAIDIALWDIKGKHFSLPIHTLLGGQKSKKILPYATGLYFTKTENLKGKLVDEALEYARQGFKAIKMKVGLGVEKDVEHVKAIRKAIGSDIKLMVDSNHAFSYKEALEFAKKVESQNIAFFEEPVSPEYYDQYAQLRSQTSIPIAGGECEYLRFGFKRLFDTKSVDIIQPDVAASGGITELKRIANLAQSYGTELIPHSWGTGIAIHAAMHLVANLDSIPGRMFQPYPYMELDRTENALRDVLIKPLIKPEDGYLSVPDRPGLGIEVDEEALQKYRIF